MFDAEEIPYRSAVRVNLPEADKASTQDEANYDTLRAVRDALASGIYELDKWSAFDLTESEMDIKQQIKAHQLAFEILSPLLEALNGSLEAVDRKYKQD